MLEELLGKWVVIWLSQPVDFGNISEEGVPYVVVKVENYCEDFLKCRTVHDEVIYMRNFAIEAIMRHRKPKKLDNQLQVNRRRRKIRLVKRSS